MLYCLLFFCILAYAGILLDKRDWNAGHCRKTGEPWMLVDRDSQGGRLYSTDSGEWCWISDRQKGETH